MLYGGKTSNLTSHFQHSSRFFLKLPYLMEELQLQLLLYSLYVFLSPDLEHKHCRHHRTSTANTAGTSTTGTSTIDWSWSTARNEWIRTWIFTPNKLPEFAPPNELLGFPPAVEKAAAALHQPALLPLEEDEDLI